MTRSIVLDQPTAARSQLGLIAVVLLPFAAGYFLSFFFRAINALLADTLAVEFGLDPAELGFMTSIYFACLAVSQLPLGALLDRYGPRSVQCVSLTIAFVGAAWFAFAGSLFDLVAARALIGFGVAAAFLSGLKAIVLWLPADRRAFCNGLLVTLGALGAVSATVPAQISIEAIGWRGLFLAIAWLTCLVAIATRLAVPDRARTRQPAVGNDAPGFREILTDRRFWALAPVSASIIGTSWALQGLWAAPWLSTVERLAPGAIVHHLLAMAVVLSLCGLALGTAADLVRRRSIRIEALLIGVAAVSLTGQMALVLAWPMPTALPWAMIAAAGAATVLSYASLARLFPVAASGRASAALNLMHLGTAFAIQSLTGTLITHWAAHRDLPTAYRMAFAANLVIQAAGLIWFIWSNAARPAAWPRRRQTVPTMLTVDLNSLKYCPYRQARHLWLTHVQEARSHLEHWRTAAIGSASLMVVLMSLAFTA